MYKKIEPVLTNIDELAKNCGLFVYSENLNGGYGCRSKSKEKDELGCCFDFDCPLAYSVDLAELKKHDDYLYKEYKAEYDEKKSTCSEEDYSIDFWLIQYRKV